MGKQKQKKKIEFVYYTIPVGDYVFPLLGDAWVRKYGEGTPDILHFHNYLEIGYCYHGSGEFVIEDRIHRYTDKMFTVIPANVPHTTNSDPEHICKWEFLFIDVEAFVKTQMQDFRLEAKEVLKIIGRCGTIKTEKNHGVLAGLISRIIEECRNQSPYYKECLKGYLRALVIEIIRLEEEREQAKRGVFNDYMKTALLYIKENYAEDIKVSDVAKHCGLSETHFRRVFQDSMNMKPVEYVNMVRIEQACELIKDKDISMEEVAYRVGYVTLSTFHRNFKKLTGLTPYHWKYKYNHEHHTMIHYQVSAKKGWDWEESYHD